MNLLKFINNRSEELLDAQSLIKRYSLKRQSEMDALKQSLHIVQWIVKWFYVIRVPFHYVFVKARIARSPKAVLAHKKIVEDQKKLRKIGMTDLKRGDDEREPA